MMNKLVPQDMFDLATKIDELNHQLVVNTSPEKVPETIRSLENILTPWQHYLNDAAKTEAWCVYDAIKMFYTHDRTRQQVINAVAALSTKITELARTWALNICCKCISDTFSHFDTPANIIQFVLAIDGAKNDCLKKAFGEDYQLLSERFKRITIQTADFED